MPNHQPHTVPDSRHLSRHERRHHRSRRRSVRRATMGNAYALIVGLGLIVLGIVFLLESAGILQYTSLWALFLFIPAAGSLAAAWKTYHDEGATTVTVRREVMAGLVLSFVAVLVMLNLNWVVIWPVFLIIAGLGSLLTVERE
ncbi:MAG: hypothetical protein K8I30_16885 [Anaerolineae bacterium]|nr:hypothetical protein [Anaerolineae bacterium]